MLEHIAKSNFVRAQRKAFWRKLYAWLSGESTTLLPYEDVKQYLPIQGQFYRGLQTIPISQIVGSVGRYRDFDRDFSPTQNRTAERWTSIDIAHLKQIPLPPIELYKIGDAYFVKDGNHRVSVARERGQTYIDAYIIEIDVPANIPSTIKIDDLKFKKASVDFMNSIGLLTHRPDARIELTMPEEYDRLLEHISAHRWYMGENLKRPVEYIESVLSWYDTVYLPFLETIQAQKLLDQFPGRTETDLYLWVIEYQWFVREAYRDNEALTKAAQEFSAKYSQWPASRVTHTLQQARWIDDLILSQDRAHFENQTHIKELRPEAEINLTLPGKYQKILDHIQVHQWYLGEKSGKDVGFDEAVASWYDHVYKPLLEIILNQDILKFFPKRTEADLYLWIIDHRAYLEEDLGWEISPETAAQDLVSSKAFGEKETGKKDTSPTPPNLFEFFSDGPAAGNWRQQRLQHRQGPFVFSDILITLDGTADGWKAFDQGVLLAKGKPVRLLGLHVVNQKEDIQKSEVVQLKNEFAKRCADLDIPGSFTSDYGIPSRVINDRAHWVDLVIMSLNFPPARHGLSRISSGIRSILRKSGRPVLTVRGLPRYPAKVLLAYDGSPKADEALFIAVHLARAWNSQVTVLSADAEKTVAQIAIKRAQQFFHYHQASANFITNTNAPESAIIQQANMEDTDWILMGGYGLNPMLEMVTGSTVDFVLGETYLPVLISS